MSGRNIYEEAFHNKNKIEGVAVIFIHKSESFKAFINVSTLLNFIESEYYYENANMYPMLIQAIGLSFIWNGLICYEVKNENNFLKMKLNYGLNDLNYMIKKISEITDQKLEELFNQNIEGPQDTEYISFSLANISSNTHNYWKMFGYALFERGYFLKHQFIDGWSRWSIAKSNLYNDFHESYIEKLNTGELIDLEYFLISEVDIDNAFKCYPKLLIDSKQWFCYTETDTDDLLRIIILHPDSLKRNNRAMVGNTSGEDFSVWYNKTSKKIVKMEIHP